MAVLGVEEPGEAQSIDARTFDSEDAGGRVHVVSSDVAGGVPDEAGVPVGTGLVAGKGRGLFYKYTGG